MVTVGLDITAKMAVREQLGPPRAAKSIPCPRCGATNPNTTNRCRTCFTPLPSKASDPPAVTARAITPKRESRPLEIDAALGELEALTRDDAPATRFQCPECGRLVDEAAAQCRCGAMFEVPSNIVGYECPVCGARVRGDATACSCGARFSN